MTDRFESQPVELRSRFHRDLEEVRSELVRLASSVTESIPRATQILLDQDLVAHVVAPLGGMGVTSE